MLAELWLRGIQSSNIDSLCKTSDLSTDKEESEDEESEDEESEDEESEDEESEDEKSEDEESEDDESEDEESEEGESGRDDESDDREDSLLIITSRNFSELTFVAGITTEDSSAGSDCADAMKVTTVDSEESTSFGTDASDGTELTIGACDWDPGNAEDSTTPA